MKSGENVKVVPITKNRPGLQEAAGDLLEQMKNLYEGVARRAYEVFEARGGSDGQHLEDWLRAESELLGMVEGELQQHADRIEARFPASARTRSKCRSNPGDWWFAARPSAVPNGRGRRVRAPRSPRSSSSAATSCPRK